MKKDKTLESMKNPFNNIIFQDNVFYIGMWNNFTPAEWIVHSCFSKTANELSKKLYVLGPFLTEEEEKSLPFLLGRQKADIFITGENRPPRFDLAEKQIGFWHSYSGNPKVLRFPNWWWLLDWPGEYHQPPYPRYGMRLSIDRLMKPIAATFSQEALLRRAIKSCTIVSHLRKPRDTHYQITDTTIGCDGYGKPFGKDSIILSKMHILESYTFCLCPENQIGDGYVTEKVPEAFHSGCIPISWAHPDDLAKDFNPEAVVNLYGLSDQEIKDLMVEIKGNEKFIEEKRNVPLLKRRPKIDALESFLYS